jgi:predicted membrane-bound spermidine synthase
VKRNAVFIHSVQAAALIACVGIGALLIRPLRAEADRRAMIIRDEILVGLESDLGITIGYKSISPALLSAVTIRDITVDFSQGSFLADEIRVHYNPAQTADPSGFRSGRPRFPHCGR